MTAIRTALATTLALICALAAGPTTDTSTKPSTRPGGDIVAPPRRDVPGRRVQLSCGELFVPAYLADAKQVDLLLWFRGAAWCVEQSIDEAHANTAVFTWSESKRPPRLRR